jgi:hypothetical protein
MNPASQHEIPTGSGVMPFPAALPPALRLLTLAAVMAGGPLHALQINLSYTTDGQAASIPAGDPNGTRLMALANAAKAYWEDIIEDNHTLNITVRYDNGIAPGFIGFWTLTDQSGGRPDAGRIDIRGSTAWYYDPTPENHSEYQMGQTLFRDATLANQANFAGTIPGVLEVAFSGAALPGAPAMAQTGTDLYTVLLHEMGHALGMTNQLIPAANQIADGDFDINPALVNGNVFNMQAVLNTGAHTACAQCVMNPTIGTGLRRLPSASDVLALANCPNPGYSQIDLPRQDFFPGGTTNWNTAANWVGSQVPDSSDDVSCRHGIDIGASPLLALSGGGACRNLLLSGATRVQTAGHKLDVALAATLQHDGNLPAPEVFITTGGELEATDAVVNGGEIDLSGGLLDLADDLLLSENTLGRQGILSGYGTVTIDGRLSNDGRIDATDANTLLFQSLAATPWDLDGANGHGEVLAIQGNLNFATGALSDAFDGFMQIEGLRTITFGQPWSLGAGGVLEMNGGDGNTATLAGALFTAEAGDIQSTGLTRITAPVQLGGSLEMIVGANSQLLLDGPATLTGGGYLLGAGANLEFNGNTTISDGILIVPATANVRLDGAHTLGGGSYSGLGTLRFNGTTTISQAVTINCEVLDFDGPGNLAKTVHVNADLTLNSDLLDITDNKFDSTLNINGSSTLMTVNGPSAWIMDGILNHTGGGLYFPSIDGVPFTMSGTTNVSESTRWDARATITGSINLPGASDRLALGGGDLANPNRIEGGSVTGAGTLRAFDAGLTGFGSIASKLDFTTGSALLADDGLLVFSGAFLTVPPLIGTAAADGILEVANAWTLPVTSVLNLHGGFVQGATITNEGTSSGHGEIRSSNITNNGHIAAADNLTLVINTTLNPDLDGTGTDPQVAGHTLNAIDGNLEVTKAPLDAIGATLTIAPGRSMAFNGGWTLDSGGTLNMTGNTAASPALLAGTSSSFRGKLNLDDHVRITSAAWFENGVVATLADAGTIVRLEAAASISKGAAFSGPGRLVIAGGNTLTLANGAAVGVAVTNDQSNLEIGASPGQAGIASYVQTSQATMVVEIFGRPETSDWDQLTVTGNAELAGRLEVVFNAATAEPCDTWKILSAASVSGGFTEFSVTGAPAGHQILKFETPTGVYLTLAKVSKFADWAAEEGLVPGNNAVDDDPDGDLIANALEMLLGSDPEVAEAGLLPGPSITTVNGVDYLSITLPIHAGSVPADLKFGAQRSTDLEVWSGDDIVEESAGFNEVLCSEMKLFRSTIPFGSLPAEFLRLQVTGSGP